MDPSREFWRDRRVVVTGGTGFIGSQIVRELVDAGGRVRSLAAQPDNSIREVEYCCSDIRDLDAVQAALQGASIVFHAAGPVRFDDSNSKCLQSVHVEGTQTVLRAAPSNCRIVHVSCLTAIGSTVSGVPLTEGAPLPDSSHPVPYIAAKRAAERLALQSDRNVVVTNPGFCVGPDDCGPSALGRFCSRYWQGRMTFSLGGGLNLVDVRDVARGHLLAAERGRSGRRYLLGGENLTFDRMFQLLASVAGFRPRWSPQLSPRMFRVVGDYRWSSGSDAIRSMAPADGTYWFGRSDKARADLGFVPRPVAQSLADAHAWHAERQSLQLSGFRRWWMRQAAAA